MRIYRGTYSILDDYLCSANRIYANDLARPSTSKLSKFEVIVSCIKSAAKQSQTIIGYAILLRSCSINRVLIDEEALIKPVRWGQQMKSPDSSMYRNNKVDHDVEGLVGQLGGVSIQFPYIDRHETAPKRV